MDSNENRSPSSTPSKRFAATLVFLILMSLASLQAWGSIYNAVLVPGKSDFIQPILWFSLTIILFSVVSILSDRLLLRVISATMIFVPSLLFALNPGHLIFLLVSVILASYSMILVQGELRERIHLSVRKCLRAGLPTFLLALSLALSSQYYVHAQSLSWEQLIPNFNLSERNTVFLFRIAGSVYQPLQELDDKDVTVDEFLRTIGVPGGEMDVENLSPGVVGLLSVDSTMVTGVDLERSVEELLLERKRDSLSKLVGRPVRGDEMMSAILSEIMRNKALSLVGDEGKGNSYPVPIIPIILAVLLFFSVYPLASLFISFWSMLAQIVFALLVRARVVALTKVAMEQEQIS